MYLLSLEKSQIIQGCILTVEEGANALTAEAIARIAQVVFMVAIVVS